jgi:hypothetical protein
MHALPNEPEDYTPDAALDALALEYEGDYGTAHGNLEVADLMNDPTANGVCRVFGLRFEKQDFSLLGSDLGTFLEDLSNTFLIDLDAVDTLPK